ncbi:MAG: hypothetical protein R3F56_24735 [Planctomycetota bacterium]
MQSDDETKARLGTALNEAHLLGVELDTVGRRAAVTFATLTLDQPDKRRLQLVLESVSRVAASLRHGAWNDPTARVEPFAPEQLLAIVESFGGQPVYGWEFFDARDDDFATWSDRLSLDWRAEGPDGRAHTLTLFQEGPDRHLDLRIWFGDCEFRDAAGRAVPVDEVCDQGRRFWEGVRTGNPLAGAHGISALREPPRRDSETWSRRDLGLGALFAVTGLLVTAFACLALQRGAPPFLWVTGCLLGPLMLLLGGNAIQKSLRAGR